MRLSITSDLPAEVAEMKQTQRVLKREAWRIVRTVSFWLERAIKVVSPVDTGRLRASWGHWTIGDLRNSPRAKHNVPSAMDAVYKADETKLETRQGSNVEYLQYQYEFDEKIDDLGDEAQDQTDRLVDDLLRDVL